MFDTRNSSGCDMGDEIVAYVYGEMDTAKRKVFDAHLKTCTHCHEEIAAFSSVSAAINEWKSAQFDPMKTPRIDLTERVTTGQVQVALTPDPGFFEKLKLSLINLPGMWQAASAFAVITIVAGLLFYGSGGFLTVEDIPDVPSVAVSTTTLSSDAVENIPGESKNPELADISTEEGVDAVSTANSENSPIPRLSRKTNTKNILPAKGRKSVPLRSVPIRETPLQATSPQENLTEVPRLSDLGETEDFEDSGLRLSELFADSGSDDR